MGQRGLLLINLIVILLLLSLYIYGIETPPKKVEIWEASKNIGNYVSVRGIVWKVSTGGDYSFITLANINFNSSLLIFTDFPYHISPGAEIEASGILQKYSSQVELHVSKKEEIKILTKEYHTSLPVLLENPQNFKGFNVEISGEVKYEKIVYLNLTDSTGYTHATVDNGYEGERYAYFCGKAYNGSLHLYFASMNCSENYEKINISEIVEQEGKKVCVHARIYNYGIYLILSSENYSIRVYAECQKLPQGFVTVDGIFYYESKSGVYVIYARNIK